MASKQDEELAQRARRLGLGRNTPKAGRALGELGIRALPELRKALTHTNPFVRSGAVHGLGAITPPHADATAAIVGALANDADPRVRETACIVLGLLGARSDEAARQALEAAGNDADERVRAAATNALEQ